MARKYMPEELQRLRDSPLVQKPEGLPPNEEWMGPISDTNQSQNQSQRRTGNRGKTDDNSSSENPISKRTYETRGKSTNTPEDIVLGPPRTAFTSASGIRNGHKASSSSQRPSFSNHEDASAKSERHNFKDRHAKDGQRPERDAEKTRDSRQGVGLAQNRRSVKDDSDLWLNIRQQKGTNQEDIERSYRRNGDREYERDINGLRETRPPRASQHHRPDGERDVDGENGARRTGAGRGRNEPSWHRKEEDGHGEIERSRPVDWQDKEKRFNKGSQRDWNRVVKVEMDPEWMDAPEPEDQRRIHTQEDFERWKELMRTCTDPAQDVPLSPVEQLPGHEKTKSVGGNGLAKGKVDIPLVVDPTLDGFFGKWNEPRKDDSIAASSAYGAQTNAAVIHTKSSKPSKFVGFFNPKTGAEAPKDQVSIPLVAPSCNATTEDKEGFQRILNMLDQQQQPINAQTSALPRTQASGEASDLSPIQSPPGKEHSHLYGLLRPKSPLGNAVPATRDSEYFLNLMQQPQQNRQNLNQADSSSRRILQDGNLDPVPFSKMAISPCDTSQSSSSKIPQSAYLTEGIREELTTRDKLNPTMGVERRGPRTGFYDALPRQSPVGTPGYPPAMQRPPGLEQPPPQYAQNVQSQRQNMHPPPGFQLPPRGQKAFPPGLLPRTANDGLQFGIPANPRMPPPGFMNGPPPGFPPLGFGHEGLPFGGFGDVGGFGQGFPSAQQRR